MVWVNQDKTAIVGVGATDYWVRGQSYPRTINEMVGEAILRACEDAGIKVQQIDGFAYYSGAGAGYGDKMDTASLMEMLGIPEVGFTASLTSGGGGAAAGPGLAAAAIMNGDASYVVSVMALQQRKQRLGTVFGAAPPSPETSFLQPSGRRPRALDVGARAATHAPLRHHARRIRGGGDRVARPRAEPPEGDSPQAAHARGVLRLADAGRSPLPARLLSRDRRRGRSDYDEQRASARLSPAAGIDPRSRARRSRGVGTRVRVDGNARPSLRELRAQARRRSPLCDVGRAP